MIMIQTAAQIVFTAQLDAQMTLELTVRLGRYLYDKNMIMTIRITRHIRNNIMLHSQTITVQDNRIHIHGKGLACNSRRLPY